MDVYDWLQLVGSKQAQLAIGEERSLENQYNRTMEKKHGILNQIKSLWDGHAGVEFESKDTSGLLDHTIGRLKPDLMKSREKELKQELVDTLVDLYMYAELQDI